MAFTLNTIHTVHVLNDKFDVRIRCMTFDAVCSYHIRKYSVNIGIAAGSCIKKNSSNLRSIVQID